MTDIQLNNDQDLVLSIKKVIVFFDLFDCPLTPNEIFNHLDKKYPLVDIINVLDTLKNYFDNDNGLFFLKGRQDLVALRQHRYNYAVRKLKIAKRYAKIFAIFPFVKVVTLANVIGAFNMRDEGDIDLFIISSKNRIWLSRFFCAGLAKILNKRPTQEHKRDKLCLSFYISEDSLNLDSLKISPHDPYFDYWLKTMVLLYNKNGIYNNFLIANNLGGTETFGAEEKTGRSSNLLNKFEQAVKTWQLKIMSEPLKKVLVSSQGKFINDKILKLYWRDRNAEILEKFNYALIKLS